MALREVDPNRAHRPPPAWIFAMMEKECQTPQEILNDPEQTDGSECSDDERTLLWNCDEIRTKIIALLRSGEIKVTHFQKENGINSNSYGRFMKLKGPYSGIDNQTYHQAHRFFRKREEKGIKPLPQRKRLLPMLRNSMVFDDCNEVRRKINAYLKEPGITAASFCREMAKSFSNADKKIQSKQLNDFLKKKGEASGAESAVYYGGYVFFEKLRIKNGTKKGKKRLESEARHPRGRELKDSSRIWEWSFGGPKVTMKRRR